MPDHSPNLTLRIGAGQLRSTPDPSENLPLLTGFVERAATAGARLVVLPEASMACAGTSPIEVAEPLDGPFATGIRAVADRLNITIVVGMYEPAGDGRAYNTLLAVGPWGQTSYRKIHLFDAFGSRESTKIAPGDEVVTFDCEGIRFGLATCYDVRFADQFTALGRAGADVVLLPASWGEGPGKAEQWDLLTRARAMDAQCWLLAAGQAWVEPKGAVPLGIGRSVLVDPNGRVVARLGHDPDVMVGDIDTATVRSTRQRIPILAASPVSNRG